jgi:peroxiredoxin
MTSIGPPAPVDDGGARHLVRGLALPDIPLPATRGPAVSLARLDGWHLIAVYPWSGRPGLPNPPGWDDIPGAHGSTPQLEGLRNLAPAFHEIGAGVLGLSLQDTAWQSELAERLGLPFPLLSDAAGEVSRALSLPTFETGGVTYLKRLTIIARQGRIERVFYPAHPPETNPREALLWLDERLTR